MDAETLKIILDLKEENICLSDAISNVCWMLSNRKYHDTLTPSNDHIRWLYREVDNLLSELPPKTNQ